MREFIFIQLSYVAQKIYPDIESIDVEMNTACGGPGTDFQICCNFMMTEYR